MTGGQRLLRKLQEYCQLSLYGSSVRVALLMASLIAGVDEAGRGPVIGPLVVAGAIFRESVVPELQFLGVKDSKTLSSNRRRILEKELK